MQAFGGASRARKCISQNRIELITLQVEVFHNVLLESKVDITLAQALIIDYS